MSKAVLISIKPEWCEMIASGKKTVEVRKTRPKMDTPFKCYIYCTTAKDMLWVLEERLREPDLNPCSMFNAKAVGGATKANGKVIGEFVCDQVFRGSEGYTTFFWDICIPSQLTEDAIIEYQGDASDVYGWHISNLVIYDKPKLLSDFNQCHQCGYMGVCNDKCWNPLQRPPQSWFYVEEL